MSFHRSGRFAVNMGLDPDDKFRIGGWSAGTMLTIDKNGNMTNPGNVTAGGGFFYASDKRLKTHIVPIDNSLEKILSLSGYTFDWKANNKKDI